MDNPTQTDMPNTSQTPEIPEGTDISDTTEGLNPAPEIPLEEITNKVAEHTKEEVTADILKALGINKGTTVVPTDEVVIETRKVDEGEIDYGTEIDPDDIKTIGTIVEKQTAGVRKQLQDTADRLEVDAFVQEKPEFAKYKPVILKYLQHPVYNQIPVKNIAAMVAMNDLVKMGAKQEREAQAKANATKGGGTSVRQPQGGGQVEWSTVPKETFEAQKRRVLQGGA